MNPFARTRPSTRQWLRRQRARLAGLLLGRSPTAGARYAARRLLAQVAALFLRRDLTDATRWREIETLLASRLLFWSLSLPSWRQRWAKLWLSHQRLSDRERATFRELGQRLADRPMFTILTPVRDAKPIWIERLVASVLEQTYDRWELALIDDASTDPLTRRALERAAAQEERITLIDLSDRGGVSRATNAGADAAHGEFLLFLDHDDELVPTTLFHFARRLQSAPDADVLYADELIVPAPPRDPYPVFKPDYSPEKLEAYNYVCHPLVVRRSLFESVGKLNPEFDGAQDHDLLLRLSRATDRWQHIPQVLYRWRADESSLSRRVDQQTGAMTPTAGLCEVTRRCVERHLGAVEQGVDAELAGEWVLPRFSPGPRGNVSILIPTRDQPLLLQRAIDSILRRTDYPDYEIIVLDDDSQTTECRHLLRELQSVCRVATFPRDGGPFNFSALINRGASIASGRFLLLLNDDVEILSNDWLSALVGYANRPGVGAVGAKLLDGKGCVQHAGLLVGAMGWAPWHALLGQRDDDPRVRDVVHFPRNVAAVTGACLITPSKLFHALGGLDENLAVSFNDVDYCLRLRQRGYRIVYCPRATLTHEGGASRGRAVDVAEMDRFRQRWLGESDPYWPAGFSRHSPNLTPTTRRMVDDVSTAPVRVLVVGPNSGVGAFDNRSEWADALQATAVVETSFLDLRQADEDRERIDREIRSAPPDVLLAIDPESSGAVARAQAAGIPVVWHWRRRFLLDDEDADERSRRWNALAGMNGVRQLVVGDASTFRWAKQVAPGADIAMIATSYPPEDHSDEEWEILKGEARRGLGIVADQATCLFLAIGFDSEGGARTLLDAYRRLRIPKGDAALVIVFDQSGGFRRVRSLWRRMRRLGEDVQIFWGGSDSLVRGADVVLAGGLEGRSARLWRAAEQGIPIVGDRRLASAEILLPNQTGLLVSGDDARSWSQAMRILVQDPSERRRLGSQARRWLRTRGTFQLHLEDWRRLLCEASASNAVDSSASVGRSVIPSRVKRARVDEPV